MFDLNALKTFVLAAEVLNFTTVAEQRNTVQSAVSAQIRKLETSIGRQLFARGRGQVMRLTPEGEAFLVYARRLLILSEEAVETVRTTGARRIIRLGTTVTLAMSVVCDVLAAFATHRPDVQIQIQCDRSDALLKRLDDGEIDVAFMMDQGRHAGRMFVHSQPLVWVCAKHFQMPDGETVPLAFLTDGRDLRRYALRALDEVGRHGHITHLSPHPIGVRALVQAGLALTVMPISAVVRPLHIAPASLSLPDLSPIALAGYQKESEGASDTSLLLDLFEASVRC
ncbi:LysR family transcriptional regulator [Roseibium sp.]|uniref:LysR family transcriptional regulator n=1 Tax=Roseibium sp. TaxID=1936156 RepID=UPI003D0A1F54